MPWFAIFLTLLLAGPITATAQAPLSASEPYRLTVCLQFSQDQIFTRFFTESVVRHVQDQLANYFGSLVEVQVVSEHPLLAKLEAGGIDGFELTPEDFVRQKLEEKLIVMRVEYRDGIYGIQWRQLDGSVHFVGPVHSRSTPDRYWLAKAICLAVKDNFAPVAVASPSGRDTAALQFRGESLGAGLKPWLADGCVLQPHRGVRQADGSLLWSPVPQTYLVLQADGKKATVVSSQADPWKQTARVVGFRAIKLTTQSGRFRLRLINAENGRPLLTGIVLAGSRGFDALTDADRLRPPDREGYVLADRPFDRLVYISISQQRDVSYRILLPITRDWCELECRLPADRKAREKDEWRRQLRYCVQDIQVLQTILDQQVRQINELNGNKRYEEALKAAEGAIADLPPLVRTAEKSVAEVERLAESVGMQQDGTLAVVRRQVAQLDERTRALGGVASDLKRTIEDLDAQDRAKVLAKLAGQALQNGDVDDAIQRLELALSEWPNSPDVRQLLEETKEVWRIKSPEHQQARDLVSKDMEGARADQLDSLLPEAEKAFRTLVGVGDYLTVRKLAKTNSRLLAELVDIVEALSVQGNTAECERYQKLVDRLAELQQQVSDYQSASSEKRPYQPAPPRGSGTSVPPPSNTETPPTPENRPATEEKPSTAENEPRKPATPPPLGIDEKEEPPLQ